MPHTTVVLLTQLCAIVLAGIYGWAFFSIQALQNCILGFGVLCAASSIALLLIGTGIFVTTAFILILFKAYQR